MKEKLYFEECSESYCYPLHYFKDRIEDGEEQIELQLAKRDIGKGYFWCEVKEEDIDIDKDMVNIHIGTNYQGAIYVEIPIAILKKKLAPTNEEK